MALAGQSTAQLPVLSGHESSVRRVRYTLLKQGSKRISSAAEASEALVTALQKEDEASLLKVLGSSAKDSSPQATKRKIRNIARGSCRNIGKCIGW